MRKALVLMMTTCILFAGCIEGLTEDVEEVVEELAPGCNDPTAFNYDENDTTATTCITEETLHRNIGEFVENSESEDSQAVIGFKMTMSGVDEEMGMGAYTMVSTTAENENTVYSGTELTIGGMALTQSWTVQENGDGTILQASYMGESFLMYSAMSWEDVSDDCDDSDDRDCVDAEISQEDCERRGGTWIEVTDRPIDGYCNFDDSGDRGDGDFEITQEECEERGGTWNVTEETDGREANNGTRTCDTWSCEEWCMTSNDDDDSEITQEDCERRGGNWTAIEETEGRAGNNSEGVQDEEFYCDFREESDREEDRDDDDATDSSEEQDRGDSDREEGNEDARDDEIATGLGMDMDIPDPMDFLSMTNGDCDDSKDPVKPGVCGFPENSEFDVGVDGITVTIPTEEGQSMEMMFDLVTGEMTGLSMDMDDGSHMKLEMLTGEEVNVLLTIDTTLEYEALPFTLEEAEAEDTDSEFICDNGQEIPASWVNDGMDDCGDNSDEGVEEQEEGPLNRTFTVTSDADFDFAGSFDDYSIVLANCVEETDDMGDTTLTCDESNSTVFSLADSSTEGRQHSGGFTSCQIWCSIDSDSSGTLTNGDVIMIEGNTSENWTHVRLHSTSADAYSDENPMLTPGFTTVLGVLSLMGAAMIGRRD